PICAVFYFRILLVELLVKGQPTFSGCQIPDLLLTSESEAKGGIKGSHKSDAGKVSGKVGSVVLLIIDLDPFKGGKQAHKGVVGFFTATQAIVLGRILGGGGILVSVKRGHSFAALLDTGSGIGARDLFGKPHIVVQF